MDYQYQQLDSRDEIRILVVRPAGTLEDDLHAKIVHRKYPITEEDGSGVNYWNATSYTWGTDPPSEPLIIDSTFPNDPNNGQTVIKITPNAAKMLRHLRDDESELYLWVDAVCLNQSDLSEKAQQIQRMDWIYRFAFHVIIWLGEDDGTTRLGIRTVQALAMMSERPGFTNDSATTSGFGLALREQLGSEQPHAIDRLFQRPWFGRRWILQEVALARDAVVCCGKYQLPWTKFRAGMECLLNMQRGTLFFQSGVVDDQSALALRTLLKVNRVSNNFLDLLWDFDKSACKEKNDVIYALSGLVTANLPAPQDEEVASSIEFSLGSDADLERLAEMLLHVRNMNHEPFAIYPNYSTPWHVVFTQVAGHYVGQIAFAAITRHLFAFGSLYDVNSDWPSWVPNWSIPRRPEPKKGMSNVVPWARPVKMVNNALEIQSHRLCTARSVLKDFSEEQQVFRDSITSLLQHTDSSPVQVEDAEIDGDVRDLSASEAIIGDLIRCGLDAGICKPVPSESHRITEAWIVNDLAAQAVARTIFTPEWRPSSSAGFLKGIMTCLQDTSLFVTDTLELGVASSKIQDGDQIASIEDYHGLPEITHEPITAMRLEAAAILRPTEQIQQEDSALTEDARYILIGPCVIARKATDGDPRGIRIKLV